MGDLLGLVLTTPAIILLLMIFFIAILLRNSPSIYEYKQERALREIHAAGAQGERIATDMIRSVMRDGDYLITNAVIQYEDRTAELDNVVVNQSGVFIVEAKNYRGELIGEEDDYEWEKIKTTIRGNRYVKNVRNPIKQVNREVFILKNFIKEYGINVWVEGYVILTAFNSPIVSEYILEDYDDIDDAIHRDVTMLSNSKVLRIVEILTEDAGEIEEIEETEDAEKVS